MKGNGRSLRFLISNLHKIEAEKAAEARSNLEAAIEAKVAVEQEIARRKALGTPDVTDIDLHPDKILIDPETGSFEYLGLLWPQHAERYLEGLREGQVRNGEKDAGSKNASRGPG
jgi:hypothetical protein